MPHHITSRYIAHTHTPQKATLFGVCVVDFAEQELIDCPYQTKSDSFYFVEDQLVMHNKADYAYTTAPVPHS